MTKVGLLRRLNKDLTREKHSKVPSSAWVDDLVKASNILFAAARYAPIQYRDHIMRHVRTLNDDIGIHDQAVYTAKYD